MSRTAKKRPDKTGAKRRPKWPLVFIAVAVIVAGGLLWRAKAAQNDEMTSDTSRSTATATRTTQYRSVSSDGTFTPRKAGYLSFPTQAKVTSVKVKVGDKVEEGDPLATIDDDELRSAVTVARAQVDAAQEQYNQALDDNSSQSTISSARAGLEAAQGELKLAENNLEKATLRSTLDGVVAAVNVEKGEQSGQGGSGTTDTGGSEAEFPTDMGGMGSGGGGGGGTDTASRAAAADIVVVQPGRWLVETNINSNDIALVKRGQAATVTPTGSRKALPATVRAVGVIGSSSTGSVTFPATVAVRGTHNDLYIGATNTVTIRVKEYKDILTIPTAAITDQDGKPVVTTLVNGQEQVVTITMGETFGSLTEIKNGLDEGATVIYFGAPR